MFRRLLQEVVATGGEDCDKTLTRQRNHVAKLLYLHSQRDYINELQEILDKNDIPYAPQDPVNSLESDGVDEIIDQAAPF